MSTSTASTDELDLAELHGLLAEYDDTGALVAAIRRMRAEGYLKMEAYTPFPVHGLAAELGKPPSRLPLLTFCGGVLGALTGYGLQYWSSVISYPLNIGGRPYHSWPAFFPVVFELAVLGAAAAAVLGMLALNGLPMPYHPVFNVPQFKLASRNRFFLLIYAADARFDRQATQSLLQSLAPLAIYDVPR